MTTLRRPNAGWFNMVCWEGLDFHQKDRLIEWGNLPIGYVPQGTCDQGAEVAIETSDDKSSGPRFYCLSCAIEYLTAKKEHHENIRRRP